MSLDQAALSPPVTSERRLVTVLFADLTGYTAFSDGRDPGEVRDFQAAVSSAGGSPPSGDGTGCSACSTAP